jgi:hypothetical protein
LEATGDPS